MAERVDICKARDNGRSKVRFGGKEDLVGFAGVSLPLVVLHHGKVSADTRHRKVFRREAGPCTVCSV